MSIQDEPSGYESSGYEPSGHESSGYKSSGYEPSGYESSGYEPSGYEPSGYEPNRNSQAPTYGFELPLLLFGGFRSIIDELHGELARRGHPDMRPAHGFALQAIGLHGATATEAGRRLGISKQAAGKTIDRLAELGYVQKAGDHQDRRRKLVRITERGRDALVVSAMIVDDIGSRWAGMLGPGRLSALEADLRTMVPGETFRLDVPGWFGG
jgi:DNA-binding MarR family transcriptional regulator